MKALLSILLGTMLLTSLVSISYATPITPAQGSGSDNNYNCGPPFSNNQNNVTQDCHGAHQGGNFVDPPHHNNCATAGQKGTDSACCIIDGITPDVFGCGCLGSITPNSLAASDIHTATNVCF